MIKKFKLLTMVLLFVSSFNFCAKANLNSSEQRNKDENNILEITLQSDKEKQKIHNFGASDSWSCQFVGKNWPMAKREKIADLLFSTKMDQKGNPVGIGLTAWRFYIGAGSAEQGSSSGIEDKWRRSECFLNSDGTYNWEKQKGQRWFLKAARQRGVNQFLGYAISPPVHLTKNGKAYSSGGNSANIPQENYDEYAEFLARVVENIQKKDNIQFDYISPFNEPQWNWDDSSQEGSPWQNKEIHSVCNLLNEELNKIDVDTKIEITEAAHIKYLYSDADKPDRGNQLEEFFSVSSENYLGDLDHIPAKIGGHSYFSTYPESKLRNTRQKLKNEIQTVDPNLEYWMTEYCILEDNKIIKGNGRNLGMKPALYMAGVIHSDLTIANASAWQWWLAISPYDYKDGLVYIDKDVQNGQIFESKMLWALGHYSRFIRPGMRRIGVLRNGERKKKVGFDKILISGYKTEEEERFVVVAVNQKYDSISVTLSQQNMPEGKKVKVYQTTSESDENLTKMGNKNIGQQITLPPRSLVTMVIE